MKKAFPLFASILLFVSCLGGQTNQQSSVKTDNVNTPSTSTSSIDDDETICYTKDWYEKERAERNANEWEYTASAIIGNDTIWFAKGEHTESYIVPYDYLVKLHPGVQGLTYAEKIIFQNGNYTCITLWVQGECEWPTYLCSFDNATGEIVSKECILYEGCGEIDEDIREEIIDGELIITDEILYVHPEIGYSHNLTKIAYSMSENGKIIKRVIISQPEKFVDVDVQFKDTTELRLFKLISLIPQTTLDSIGLHWDHIDRYDILYGNVVYNKLVKSHKKMQSISYKDRALNTLIDSIGYEFRLITVDYKETINLTVKGEDGDKTYSIDTFEPEDK